MVWLVPDFSRRRNSGALLCRGRFTNSIAYAYSFLFLPVFFCLIIQGYAQIPQGFKPGKPLPYGHSHNDYTRKTPLWEALSFGFTSLEIDIFLASDNSLRVSHIPLALNTKPTLEELYLKPLKTWIDQNGGYVFQNPEQVLTLMIDIKTDGNQTYPFLKKALEPYLEYLTTYMGRSFKEGPLRIMISGNRPMKIVSEETEQWVSFDAPIGGDYVGIPVRIDRQSASYSSYFRKRGGGKLSEMESAKMRELSKEVTERGREIRFWAAGNNPTRWHEMLNNGVTIINVDKLARFKTFIEQRPDKN